jgi:hypothetical protein
MLNWRHQGQPKCGGKHRLQLGSALASQSTLDLSEASPSPLKQLYCAGLEQLSVTIHRLATPVIRGPIHQIRTLIVANSAGVGQGINSLVGRLWRPFKEFAGSTAEIAKIQALVLVVTECHAFTVNITVNGGN